MSCPDRADDDLRNRIASADSLEMALRLHDSRSQPVHNTFALLQALPSVLLRFEEDADRLDWADELGCLGLHRLFIVKTRQGVYTVELSEAAQGGDDQPLAYQGWQETDPRDLAGVDIPALETPPESGVSLTTIEEDPVPRTNTHSEWTDADDTRENRGGPYPRNRLPR